MGKKSKAKAKDMKRCLAKIDRGNEKMINLAVGAGEDAEKIPIYNQILINASPEFKTLVESMDPGSTDLEIVGVSQKIMSLLTEYIYQTYQEGEPSLPITDANVHELLFASQKFGIVDARSLCRKYLKRVEITEENCIHHFIKTHKATKEKEKAFNKKCLNFALSTLGQVSTTRSFNNLTLLQLDMIIDEGRAQGICSEDLLCDAVVKCLKYHSKGKSSTAKEIIDKFPSKDHKLKIIQALFEISNPKLQQFAFQLISILYIAESKNQDSNNNNNTADDNNDCSVIGVNISDSKTTTTATSLKRLHSPSHDVDSDLKKKKTSNQSSVNDDSSSSTAALAVNATESNELVATSSIGTLMNPILSKIYFLTQFGNFSHLWAFDLHNLKVQPAQTFVPQGLSPLRSISLQYYRGHIYFMGGMSQDFLSTDDMYIFNLEKNTWTIKKMLQPRHEIKTVLIDSCIYAIGGRQNKIGKQTYSSFTNHAEMLNLDTHNKEWVELAEKSIRRRNRYGLVAFKNRIYTIGGFTFINGNEFDISGICEMFNPQASKKKWKLLKAVLSTPRYGLVAVSTENAIYAIGGMTAGNRKTTTVEILRANSQKWEVGPELNSPRSHASGVYCKELNVIFVFGGDESRKPTIESLNLTTNTWSVISGNYLPDTMYYSSVAFQPCD